MSGNAQSVNDFLTGDNGRQQDGEQDFDYERQGYAGNDNHEQQPTPQYIPQYSMQHAFPMHEVVPNTFSVGQKTGDPTVEMNKKRNSEQQNMPLAPEMCAVTANVLNVDDLVNQENVAGKMSHNDMPDAAGNGGDDIGMPQSVPMMVKPKAMYQNPQTPTVLPSTYHPINKWSEVKHSYLREFLAEFMGTMVLIIFGDAVGVQVGIGAVQQQNAFNSAIQALISDGSMTENEGKQFKTLENLVSSTGAGTFDDIPLAWAAAVVMGYFAAGGSAISGAHLNPSVTVANWFFRGFPKEKVFIYIAGQVLGGFIGALIVYAYYKKVISVNIPNYFEEQSVANYFCTFPKEYLSSSRQFVSEFITTAMFIAGIFSLTDPYTCLSSDLFPLMLFILIFVLNAAMSFQTGAAINLARDLGPRLALYAVGFSREVLWINNHHYFWVPMVAPLIGSLMGGVVYDVCVYQGHESPVNWPLSVYKEMFFRAWHRRPGWKKRSRGRATSDLSDFSYKSDDDLASNEEKKPEKKEKLGRTRTASNGSSIDGEPKQKSVQFKSVQRGRGTANGVPTILEEEDSIETASLGDSHSSMQLSDSNSLNTVKEDSLDEKY
ncbi:hypothetical protein TPHA_0F00190 [Tetrapisispora phaffii CBS 4417]|uniref:Uncharacterized protein n=1 Tax=Tetrapisispora phaffii (strain ATCC 24235 / CBS 4417 / NBRC 1672 / NRRL Y-8282 / UCD 70-5) TaxID=1071381 RepID=G8BUS4_TETPH|nr:hypothetical protein TPHA_0F00190 [Tetrapisispora phaffii CBS 4417]CCE63506.1 hypothetical protein TPHA_0F00190 [Tetrapisispora phaffii CBS 4417]